MSTKSVREMSLDDLRAAAVEDGYKFYKEQLAQNPTEENRQLLAAYCEQHSICMDERTVALYKKPMGELTAEWEREGKAIEAQELEGFRERNADLFIASEPRYEVTPKNGKILADKILQLGMRGTLADIKAAFEICVERGELQPKHVPPAPVHLHTAEELRQMSTEQIKATWEDYSRRGIL